MYFSLPPSQFLHSENAAEQTALVPVITQLLKLSPQEMKFLQDTVQGKDPPLPTIQLVHGTPHMY